MSETDTPWTAKLEEHLQLSMDQSGVQVISVLTASGAGKSTSVTAHITKLAMQGKAPGPVVYLVTTDAEAGLISDRLKAMPEGLGSIPEEDNPLMVIAMQRFYDEGRTIHNPMTLILDVNWYPGVTEEIIYAHLHTWTKHLQKEAKDKDVHVSVVLFNSVFESERTTNLFREAVGESAVHVCYGPVNRQYKQIHKLKPDWHRTFHAMARPHITYGGRVVLSVGNDLPEGFKEGEEFALVLCEIPGGLAPEEIRAVSKAEVLNIDGDMTYSAAITQLRIFVSLGMAYNSTLLDLHTTQLIWRCSRPLEYCELARQLSWVHKSGFPDVQIMATWGKAELREKRESFVAESVEKLGPAWNKDFAILVLRAIHCFPDRHRDHMPLRKPLLDQGWIQMVRKLQTVKCIVFLGPARYKITLMGRRVLYNWEKYGTDFHTSLFLANVDLDPKKDPIVMKLAIRMAALVHQGVGNLFTQTGKPTGEHFGFLSPPITRAKAHHGILWFVLSLFLKGEMESIFPTKEDALPEVMALKRWVQLGVIHIDRRAFTRAKTLIARLDEKHNIPKDDVHYWMKTPLTKEQIEVLDKALMWSWLHRMVMLPSNRLPSPLGGQWEEGIELVSGKDCVVDLSRETMDVDDLPRDGMGGGPGGVAAIYMRLTDDQDTKDQDRVLKACWLTAVPMKCFADFTKETKFEWPMGIMKTNY